MPDISDPSVWYRECRMDPAVRVHYIGRDSFTKESDIFTLGFEQSGLCEV